MAFAAALLGCGQSATPDVGVDAVNVAPPAAMTEEATREQPVSDSPPTKPAELSQRESAELNGDLTRFMAPCPSLATTLGACVVSESSCTACAGARDLLATAVRGGATREIGRAHV